eukprot:6042413-Lingulodinium_polyedra.AAC.1
MAALRRPLMPVPRMNTQAVLAGLMPRFVAQAKATPQRGSGGGPGVERGLAIEGKREHGVVGE